TVLAIYTGTNVSGLKRTANNDDEDGYYTSEVKFNATNGIVYNIAMDGSYGASGNIVLTWSLEVTNDLIPEILVQPQSKAAALGDNVALSVVARASGTMQYQWFL